MDVGTERNTALDRVKLTNILILSTSIQIFSQNRHK